MKGITPNMPPEQYFAIPAMNQSTLKKALVNSEELKHAIEGGVNVTLQKALPRLSFPAHLCNMRGIVLVLG